MSQHYLFMFCSINTFLEYIGMCVTSDRDTLIYFNGKQINAKIIISKLGIIHTKTIAIPIIL